jgi:hypothetical protein
MLHTFPDPGGPPLLYAPAGLLRLAAARCGLNVPGDLDVLAALEKLCAGFEAARPNQTSFGKLHTQALLLDALAKRLRLADYLTRFPEIRATAVPQPIIIVAPFRTGTTFLHRLLSRDPASRWPRVWEIAFPAPAAPRWRGETRYFADDARVAAGSAALRILDRASPALSRLHPMSGDLAEECFGLLETSLMSHSFLFYAELPSYAAWLDSCGEAEWRTAYERYADQLRLLQWWFPGRRWVLKSPVHLWHLEALLAVLPDAHVVQLHRDATAVMHSFHQLLSAHRDMMCKPTPAAAIGDQAVRYMTSALDRAVAARRRIDAARFIDIGFDDLMADPAHCVRTIYRRVGQDVTPEAEAAFAAWLARETPGPRRDGPSLDGCGAARRDLRDAFAAYDAFWTRGG